MTFGRSRRFGQTHRTSAEHSAELPPNVDTTFFTGECTERPGNVVASIHVSAYTSSTNKISKFGVSSNLQEYRWTTSSETLLKLAVLGFRNV